MFAFIRNTLRRRQLRAARKYACCRKARNLTRGDSGRPDVYLEVCRCGRRHFIAQAETGSLGAQGSSIGR